MAAALTWLFPPETLRSLRKILLRYDSPDLLLETIRQHAAAFVHRTGPTWKASLSPASRRRNLQRVVRDAERLLASLDSIHTNTAAWWELALALEDNGVSKGAKRRVTTLLVPPLLVVDRAEDGREVPVRLVPGPEIALDSGKKADGFKALTQIDVWLRALQIAAASAPPMRKSTGGRPRELDRRLLVESLGSILALATPARGQLGADRAREKHGLARDRHQRKSRTGSTLLLVPEEAAPGEISDVECCIELVLDAVGAQPHRKEMPDLLAKAVHKFEYVRIGLTSRRLNAESLERKKNPTASA